MICLMTDFGIDDIYVGIMKGVIKNIAPEVPIIDLTHSIEPYNIMQAGFVLSQALPYFPENTIFITVIDPGVGTDRASIICRIDNKSVICPNNGILTYISQKYEITDCRTIAPNIFCKQISNTFHGRDVFAPFAAKYFVNKSIMYELEEFPQDRIVIKKEFLPVLTDDKLEGQIAHIDRFGNLITNIEPVKPISYFKYKFHEFETISKKFYDVEVGEPLVYIGSSGYYEIAVNSKNAKKYFNAKIGDRITAVLK